MVNVCLSIFMSDNACNNGNILYKKGFIQTTILYIKQNDVFGFDNFMFFSPLE